MKPIVFTDLDGSLLNHENYSFEAAQPALNLLQRKKIPVIPNTSKTMAELLPLRTLIANNDPFIVENGAAIYIPVGYFLSQPKETKKKEYQGQQFWQYSKAYPRSHWQEMIDRLHWKNTNDYLGFDQMGISGILKHTGLRLEDAMLANERAFSEPLLWLGKQQDKKEFIASVKSLGAEVVEGGRFLHIIDPSTDKASAMNQLIEIFKEANNQDTLCSIALGDSSNDISMLNAADYAAVIRSPSHSRPSLSRQENTYISSDFGPCGWNQVIQMILLENFQENEKK